ncbi:glycoside hydrolase domain-containing protein [Massilia timonae]|uniref:glycoside hydrolase domain-containing protein n=1 Tax=Massilia timonae TaxID=47229 RepID=UPI000EED6165|nr:glycoside hydrolase domain-containing protein [Massilia timonae]HAK91971.1 hypothetical protein [Massilia timonae]
MGLLRGCDSPFTIAAHAASLRRRGIDFVMRRYSRDPSTNLDAGEAQRLCGAGLRIGALWEGRGARDRLTRQQGLRDGAEALHLARAAGQPPGSAIYFALGEDTTPADIDGVLKHYLAGVRSALGGAAGYRVGVHGSHAWCAGLVDRGLGALSWLVSMPAGGVAPRHNLLQWPSARLVLDGAELRLSPVLGQPGRDPGLFQLAGPGAALSAAFRRER